MLMLLAYIVLRAKERYVKPRLLFRTCAVMQAVEDYSRLVFSCIMLALIFIIHLALSVLLSGGLLLKVLISVFCLACVLPFFVILYLRASTGRNFILSAGKEDLIKEMIKGNLRDAMVQKPEDDQKMSRLYSHIIAYMEDGEPYLDEKFSLKDMAQAMYSNKVYISKTVNVMSGRNFRQFINYYRVNYAAELMKKDPRMKVVEIATMSGYHNVVSFNQSFKYFMGETPSAYLQRQQDIASGFVVE